MEKKIREYVDRKFVIYPNTKKNIEFSQKLLIIMLDKYRDCRKCGMTTQKSYALALSVMNNFSKECKIFSEKVNTDMMSNITSYMLFGSPAA